MTAKRRGVSPVIATLLLIVIAVAAAVLTYIWVTGYMGKVTGTVEQTSTQQLQEKIKINAVTVTSSGITISVANIGNVNVTLAGAYILFQNGTVVSGCQNNTLATKLNPLKPGDIAGSVEIPSGCTLTKGLTYVAKVVTAKGTEATYTFTRE
jgi:flagellin-like protein